MSIQNKVDYPNKESLFKSAGVLWKIALSFKGGEYIHSPLCPNESCHTVLDRQSSTDLYCVKCKKQYKLEKDYEQLRQDIQKIFEGFKTLDWSIYSLDLPPSKVKDEDKEDDTYWVQAKINQKEGKKMAIVYFGERIKDQTKQDFTQIFLDFDDEQLRFDKTNKNPMKLLSKLTAEFQETTTTVSKK